MIKTIKAKTKKRRYIIGIGYPWYGNAYADFGQYKQTSHGLGSIKLYDRRCSYDTKKPEPPEVIMLDPKGTHNGKKYRLILEEI